MDARTIYGEAMSIGVLDDDKRICWVIKVFLELQGYTVFIYTDPTDFATCLIPRNTLQFDCIIVDFHLTGHISGVEFIQQVRKHHPSLPAILISASLIPQTALQGLSGVSILQKPFPLIELLQAIKNLQGK